MDNQEMTLFMPVASAVPGEWGFHFRVPHSVIGKFTPPTVNVTTYGGSAMPNKLRLNDKFGTHAVKDFLFKGWQDGPEGHMTAVFHRLRSTSEIVTAVADLGDTYSISYPWPPVLLHLGANVDDSNPLTVEIGGELVELPRLEENLYHLPGGSYSSPVTVEVYVSHTNNFPPQLLTTDVPVPTTVQWRERNIGGRLSCLHSDVSFLRANPSVTALQDWGTGNSKTRDDGSSFYPATNHVTWRRHCYDVNIRRSADGQRVLTRFTVDVPRGFQAISQFSA